MNWKLFSGTSQTLRKKLEGYSSARKRSVLNFPYIFLYFFPANYIFLVAVHGWFAIQTNVWKVQDKKNRLKKIYRPTWWVGFTAWRFEAINVENRGNGHTWRMLVISDMPDIGDFRRRSPRSAYKIAKFFCWLYSVFDWTIYTLYFANLYRPQCADF